MSKPKSPTPIRTVRCPYCKKASEYSADNVYRPFCSERCQLLDLGAWADENFRIPDPQTPSEPVNENSEEDSEIH